MNAIAKFIFVLGLFLLVAAPVLAQSPEPTSSTASDNAFELFPESISNTFTNLIDQFWDPLMNKHRGIIQYSKEQLAITPDDSFTSQEGIDFKIKESLQEKKNSVSSNPIRVNIIPFTQKQSDAITSIEQKSGVIIRARRYSKTITADIPENKLLEIAQSPHIESIWPDRIFFATLDGSVPQINVPAMWGAGYQGSGVKVAVLDTGINASHPMLQGKVILQQNFTPSALPDVLGHGTQVAGIIAGSQNGANTYNGVAPQAQLFNLKVLDDTGHGSESWIEDGIEYAVDPDANALTDDGADIINLSLGYNLTSTGSPILTAINSAIAAGVVVVVSAGNCGSGCPSSECQGFIGITTPGDAPNAITVGAVDEANQYACFSSGEIIGNQIKPDVSAPGVNISSSYLGSGVLSSSGTSFAAPHVSGLAALILQSNPGIAPADVKYLLEQTADDYGPPGKDVQYGAGIVNAANLLPSSVIQLLHYSLSISSPVIEQNQSITITLTSVADDISSISSVVTHPNGLQTPITLTQNGLVWSATFNSTAQNGAHSVDVNVTNVGSITTPLQKTFIVRAPSTTGMILSYFLPTQAIYGVPVTASISFQNTGNYNAEVLVELQEWKEDYFERIRFSDPTPVNANQTISIPISWTPQSTLGNKTIKLVATFDDSALEVDQNVLVIDGNIPQVNSTQFTSAITLAQPQLISIQAEDLSHLRGIIHVTSPQSSFDVPLLNTSFGDGNQWLRAQIEPSLIGSHSFTIELCDAYNNCTITPSQQYSISACSNPPALIFTSDSNSIPFNFLSSNYCVGFWNVLEQTPSQSFLQSFPLVYWDAAGSYASAPDENASLALQSYNGNLIVEGDDIALRHVNNSFMQSRAHSALKNDFSFDENFSIPLLIAQNHRIFDNISSPLSFVYSAARVSPDALNPDLNGVALANWDVNGAGIIAYQQGIIRHLMLPFSSRRMPLSIRETFLSNIFNWMFSSSGPDGWIEYVNGIPVNDSNQLNALRDPSSFSVNYLQSLSFTETLSIYVHPHYFVQGINTFPIHIRNDSTQALTNVPLQVWVDQSNAQTLNVTIPANAEMDVNATVPLPAGTHTITTKLNPAASPAFNEFNTLNNITSIQVWVAPSQPNLQLLGLYESPNPTAMDIEVEYANFGGADAPATILTLSGLGVSVPFFTPPIPKGAIVRQKIQTGLFRFNLEVAAVIDSQNQITESNENDNSKTVPLFFCTKENILIVNDNDAEAYVDVNASSADVFENALKEAGYCVQRWDENVSGIPSLNELNAFPLVIWSAGDYWNQALDENDFAVLQQYNGNVWIEGNDIGFDHADDNAFASFMQADFNRDILPSGMVRLNFSNGLVYGDLSFVDLNLDYSGFPDAFVPLQNSFSFSDWNIGLSAICANDDVNARKLISGFALDSIQNPIERQKFIARTSKWLLAGGNQSPSAPTALLCNNVSCADGNFGGVMSIECGGSTDPENNNVLYELEVGLEENNGPALGAPNWWDSNWLHRIPLLIQNNANEELPQNYTVQSQLNLNELVGAGKLLPSLQDLRVIFQNMELDYSILPSSSAYMDGSTRLESSAVPNSGLNDLTLEAWFNTQQSGVHQHIAGKRDAASQNWIRAFVYSTNGFASCETGSTDLYTDFAVTDGKWHHIACVRQGNVFKIYLDGIERNSGILTANLDNPALFEIGKLGNYPGGFVGLIEEVRYSNVARYTSNFIPSTQPFSSDTSTLGLWHLDDSLEDASSNAFTLTAVGSMEYGEGKIVQNTNGANALLFQLQLPISPLASNGSDYFVYVGNPSSSIPVNDLSRVWLADPLFETNWNIAGNASSKISLSNQSLSFSNVEKEDQVVVYKEISPTQNWQMEFELNNFSGENEWYYLSGVTNDAAVSFGTNMQNRLNHAVTTYWNNNKGFWIRASPIDPTIEYFTGWNFNIPYYVRMQKMGQNVDVNVYANPTHSQLLANYSTSNIPDFNATRVFAFTAPDSSSALTENGSGKMKNFRVQKAVSNAPTITFAPIQSNVSVVPPISWFSFAIHSQNYPFSIDVTPAGHVENIDLRCRAFDDSGNGRYSDYFSVDANISIN